MESKHPPKEKKGARAPLAKSVGELSNHLADIELKLDHIIERIQDSLHRKNIHDRNGGEDAT